jgi:carbohydrate diacid regulator
MVPTDPMMHSLPPALAQEIATDLGVTVGLHVLITDREGVIIGSGDPRRVGQLHSPSLEVMATLEPETTTAQQARVMRVRPGITWPVVIAGEAVGTVGLTGSPRTVYRFGLIVQRQIEILVRESELLRSKLVREQALRELVRDIAFFDADTITPATLTSHAAELGVDLRLPRVAIVIDHPASISAPAMLRLAREVFNGPQDLVAELSPARITVLHRLRDDPETAGNRLVEQARVRHDSPVWIGIGEVADDVARLHGSYQDASAAARLGPTATSTSHVFPIGRLRVHQLLDSTGRQAQTRFVGSLLGELPAATNWPEARATLIAWAESGFNLVRAAELLHIHRNTLLYRLDKLSQHCGQPVREPGNGIALYLACLVDQGSVGRSAQS